MFEKKHKKKTRVYRDKYPVCCVRTSLKVARGVSELCFSKSLAPSSKFTSAAVSRRYLYIIIAAGRAGEYKYLCAPSTRVFPSCFSRGKLPRPHLYTYISHPRRCSRRPGPVGIPRVHTRRVGVSPVRTAKPAARPKGVAMCSLGGGRAETMTPEQCAGRKLGRSDDPLAPFKTQSQQ